MIVRCLGYSNQSLAYVDDDWAGFDDCAFDKMFAPANIETITDPATTDVNRYADCMVGWYIFDKKGGSLCNRPVP